VDLALVHHPVCNRNDEIIGSAVTNLDLHDIARAGRTYGLNSYYVVTPFSDQQQLVREILDHWLTGYGSTVNKPRKEALSIVRVCDDLSGLYREVTTKWGKRPTVLATSARDSELAADYLAVRERMFAGEPFLLLFGTGWGLAPEIMDSTDGFLPPVTGLGDYNHLSVRSAVSIILDRLLGDLPR